jgi:hypothetical protein
MKSRRMTVCRGPTLRLQGCSLERAGFVPGTPVKIHVSKGRLVLEAIDLAAEEEAAIKAFIHAEQELSQEREAIAAAANAWFDALWPARIAAPGSGRTGARVGDGRVRTGSVRFDP